MLASASRVDLSVLSGRGLPQLIQQLSIYRTDCRPSPQKTRKRMYNGDVPNHSKPPVSRQQDQHQAGVNRAGQCIRSIRCTPPPSRWPHMPFPSQQTIHTCMIGSQERPAAALKNLYSSCMQKGSSRVLHNGACSKTVISNRM